MTEHLISQPALRPARAEDFNYCARLYFKGMDNIIKELNLDMNAQVAGFRQRWDVGQIRIITASAGRAVTLGVVRPIPP
jgi:hypothetical protein